MTSEYIFYNVMARATTTEVIETILMESPVRSAARSIITAENPLPRDAIVTMGSIQKPEEWWTCDSSTIRVKELVPFTGHPEGSFEVEYRPLVITQHPKEHLLTIMTKDLGTFKYKIVVKALPPTLRQTLRFEVPLGSIQTENFVFRAFNTSSCTFHSNIKRSDCFSVQKTITVDAVKDWEGADVRLPIAFEPTEIGEFSDVLNVTSTEGGDYICDIVGVCTAPLPQGPFNFTEGASVEVPFRNCFSSSCRWLFSVDSPHFRLPSSSVTVPAKTKGSCVVVFEPSAECHSSSGTIVAAKLFVKCESKQEIPPWVFYLKGKTEPRSAANSGDDLAASGHLGHGHTGKSKK